MRAFVAAVAALAIGSPAFADIQYYEISGTLTESQTAAPINLPVSVGTAFTGVIAYNPSVFTCAPLGSNNTLCDTASPAALAWEVMFGPFALIAQNQNQALMNTNGDILFLGGSHLMLPLAFDGYNPTPQIDTYLAVTPTTPSTSGLPSSLLGQEQISFLENAYLINANNRSNLYEWDFGGTVTHIQRIGVPEPGTGVLMLFGVGALLLTRRLTRC